MKLNENEEPKKRRKEEQLQSKPGIDGYRRDKLDGNLITGQAADGV
jgi:hypothetical protein